MPDLPDDLVPDDTTDTEGAPFRDAEAWLAARGVQRDPIRVRPRAPAEAGGQAPPGAQVPQRNASAEAPHAGVPQAPAPAEPAASGQAPPSASAHGQLDDEVASAVAYARRATSNAPRSEQRLRASLEQRDVSAPAIELALQRCRQQGIVDDPAFARALVEEGRRKGHAPLRIRTDLRRRDLPDDVIDAVLEAIGDRDEEIVAFDVAKRRAPSLRGLDDETAFRRLVSYLARRGYNEGLSRKVARIVVFNEAEERRNAER